MASSKLCLVLLLVMFTCSQSANEQQKETTVTLYFQTLVAGPNATIVTVTGIPGKVWAMNSFGTVLGVDDPLTEGLSGGSAPVGRGQGMLVNTASDGSAVYLLLSIVFTNKEYNGSTIEIQGVSRPTSNGVVEVPVVGGTGMFRFGKGYATLEAAYLDPRRGYAVTRCKITLQI
ncbi:hypothetical protein NMG60_11035416 [Bertholletia excelsa]